MVEGISRKCFSPFSMRTSSNALILSCLLVDQMSLMEVSAPGVNGIFGAIPAVAESARFYRRET